MTYQGWTNAKTWCIALTIDNNEELFNKMLEQVRYGNPPRILVAMNIETIKQTAPWVWDDEQGLDNVDFKELKEHYLQKIAEGC